jgi:hypothetical protein
LALFILVRQKGILLPHTHAVDETDGTAAVLVKIGHMSQAPLSEDFHLQQVESGKFWPLTCGIAIFLAWGQFQQGLAA